MHWSYQVPSRDQAGKKNGELQNIWLHNQQHLYVVIRQCCRCKVKKYTERKTKVVLISFFKEPNWWFLSKNNFRITVKNIQMLKREGSFTTFCSVSWCGTFLLGIDLLTLFQWIAKACSCVQALSADMMSQTDTLVFVFWPVILCGFWRPLFILCLPLHIAVSLLVIWPSSPPLTLFLWMSAVSHGGQEGPAKFGEHLQAAW